MSAALLFSPDEMGDDSLRRQLANRPDYDRVWLDRVFFDNGAEMKVMGDVTAMLARVEAAKKGELLTFDTSKRWGVRDWGRKVRTEDRFDTRRVPTASFFAYVATERAREQPVFGPKRPTGPKRLMTAAEIELAIDLHRCRYALPPSRRSSPTTWATAPSMKSTPPSPRSRRP